MRTCRFSQHHLTVNDDGFGLLVEQNRKSEGSYYWHFQDFLLLLFGFPDLTIHCSSLFYMCLLSLGFGLLTLEKTRHLKTFGSENITHDIFFIWDIFFYHGYLSWFIGYFIGKIRCKSVQPHSICYWILLSRSSAFALIARIYDVVTQPQDNVGFILLFIPDYGTSAAVCV